MSTKKDKDVAILNNILVTSDIQYHCGIPIYYSLSVNNLNKVSLLKTIAHIAFLKITNNRIRGKVSRRIKRITIEFE